MTRKLLVLIIALLALTLAGNAAAEGNAPPATNIYTGTLTVIVGDPMPVAGEPMTPVPPIFTLHLTDGRELTLLPGAAGENDLLRLAGQQVSVTVPVAEAESALAADDLAAPGVPVASAALAPGAVMVSPEVSGNTKWLSIACKFADVTDKPKLMSYFRNMYADAYPGLDHYWREASYGNINLAGSTAVGWYTLPQPVGYYVIDDDTLKWDELLHDCAALAAPAVDFAGYMGINLMFNAEIGCCAWGGDYTMTLDGVTKNWAVTWLPPFAYTDLGYVQHEMTHAYGILWHSYAGSNAYGDYWDVVSRALGGDYHQVYGNLGQHTQAYHRHYLGWIPSERVLTLSGNGPHTVTLERATQPGLSGPLMVIIPIQGSSSHYYVLEARQLVGYDNYLEGNSITIHEIGGPRQLVQAMDPCEIAGYTCHVWHVGETWAAPTGDFTIHVDDATATGFTVTVTGGWVARTTTLAATADTYTDAENPDTNYGVSPVLRMRTGVPSSPTARTTLMRYDWAQLPPRIFQARLRLYAVEGPTTDYYPMVEYVVGCDQVWAWNEYTVTWRSAFSNNCIGYYAPWVYPGWIDGNWYEWDMTGILVAAMMDNQGTLLVQNTTMGFSSREGANPPQLIIEYLVLPDEPTTHTFTPTNDATVSQAKPKLISGGKPTLQVQDAAKDLNAYIKFNVTGLDGAVRSATLRLWVTNGGPDGGRVYTTSPFYPGTTTQWLETGLKWNNAPAISGAALDTAGAVAAGQWIELDVTAAITGNGRASFALTNDATDMVVYSSKEGAHAPELVIVTD